MEIKFEKISINQEITNIMCGRRAVEKCSYVGCDSYAEFIDSSDNYLCESCMEIDIENNYTVLDFEDYEKLDWEKYPKNGYCE